MKVKAFIIMYNRLTWPKRLAEQLSDSGCEVILIDNNSTYPPLLEWYEKCPYKVFRPMGNFGHQVLWTCKILENNYPDDRYYIVTDHDLDIEKVPGDWLDKLRQELDRNKETIVYKVGLSLDISDLPVNPYTEETKKFETDFWKETNERGFYRADIDTTLALYDRQKLQIDFHSFYSALRSPPPYTTKHLPWYTTEEWLKSNPEELYYYQQCNVDMRSVRASHWSSLFRSTFNV